jgi:hypothetical protein
MNQRNGLVTAALAASLVAAPALAQDRPLYFGLKAGVMDADAAGFDTSSNFGLVLGYDLRTDVRGTFSVEGEYTRELTEGDIRFGGLTGEWRIETFALYGAYRTGGNAYVKGKLGYLWEDIEVNGISGTIAGKDEGLSLGAGVGFRFGRDTMLELEYTLIEDDVSFYSIGYLTRF